MFKIDYTRASSENSWEPILIMAKETLRQIETIGIPKALLYFRYGRLWESFFTNLGYKTVVSQDTDRDIAGAGMRASNDECCLASKVYMGHVESLLGRCDAVFVPCFASSNVRAGFCTKYQSLPDMVANTFRDEDIQVLSILIEDASDKKGQRSACIELAKSLGVGQRAAKKAYAAAEKENDMWLKAVCRRQAETLKLVGEYNGLHAESQKKGVVCDTPPMLPILLVAHPYIAHDRYMSDAIIKAMEDMGVCVIFADEVDREKAYKASFGFSETLPWTINRELAGAIGLLFDKVAGIVLLSAFPCGPDSMFNDAVMRSVKGKPILNIMVDGLSGDAGVLTRLESFIDILRYKDKGGYLNG